MPNPLAFETSLYLRQHSNNPVYWFPWGPEALAQAKELDRPIFLSIGYSACHWCHVMDHESFSNPQIAHVLNESFVCIKVDREERPDLDDIYMKAVQLLNHGQGGWPMSVWLTPEQKPFYAGTYFPPQDRYGRPGFFRVITALADAWADRREELLKSAEDITKHLGDFRVVPPAPTDFDAPAILRNAAAQLTSTLDRVHGGFGVAPKFPHAGELRLLLRLWQRFGDESALHAVRLTLNKMARGGLYDQIGGGFHRYSVDAKWLVPHFEKMLYDNALLSVVYLEAHQATDDPFYRQIVEETLEYVLREMTSPLGGFYSTQDADSEGEEGKFYVWSHAEFEEVLGAELAGFARSVWDVTEGGNFEGHNILHRFRTDAEDAARLGHSLAEFRSRLNEAKWKLRSQRDQRVWPGRDEKLLASWNGLMIAAFARAGAVLERSDFTQAAIKAAEFVLGQMRHHTGRLFHVASDTGAVKLPGFLEDYAYLTEALTHLYEATFEPRWLNDAAGLTEVVLKHFADADGGFFATADDSEQLILRNKDQLDSSTPSSTAMAAMAMLRLAKYLGREDFRTVGFAAIQALAGVMRDHPSAVGQMLMALDFDLGPTQEMALAGDFDSPEFQKVLRASRTSFAPNRIIVAGRADSVPLLKDRPATGPMTLYLCENNACDAPITDVASAVDRLAATR